MLTSSLLFSNGHLPHSLFTHTYLTFPLSLTHSSASPEVDKQKTAHRSPPISCHNYSLSSCSEQFSSNESTLNYSHEKQRVVSFSSTISRSFNCNMLALMLQSCFSRKQVRVLHKLVMIASLTSSGQTFVFNNLISAYLSSGDLLSARKVFDQMVERNVVTWTAMLSGYEKIGLEQDFYGFLEYLLRNCFELNGSTFVCILNQCGRSLDEKLGEQVHARIVKSNLRELIVDSALVKFYSQCGNIARAFEIFNRMLFRDVICWTIIITAFAQQGLANDVFLLFRRMQDEGVCPNEFTFCSCLNACGEAKALNMGKELHAAVVKKLIRYDVFLGSSLIDMYMKCGKVRIAKNLFDKMSKRNTVTWTCMIAGYARNGIGEKAVSLFRKMKRRRIFPSNLTMVSILTSCGLVGNLLLGKEVHAQIFKNKMEGNVHIGSTLVWFYCKSGKHNYARTVLQYMQIRDVVSWTAFISGQASFGSGFQALESVNLMLLEGVEPNPFTYSSALKACTRVEAIREGRWLHASANKTQSLSNVYVGSALIDLYAKCGCVDDAFRVFSTMVERNVISWKSMILGYARSGMCTEALKLMYQMQAEGVVIDELTVATVLAACPDIKWDVESLDLCSFTSR